MKKIAIIFFLITIITPITRAQTIQVKSTFLSNNRRIHIQLPEDYTNSIMTYPVIYIFDGQILFDSLKSIYKYNSDLYPDAILVGVEQINRYKEFIAPINQNEENIEEAFANFFLRELIPHIDAKYRTQKLKIAIGHSHGGTFVLNIMLDSSLINYGISISPSIWVNDYRILSKIKPNKNKSSGRNYLYLGCGEQDGVAIKKGIELLKEKLEQTPKANYDLNTKTFAEEDHNSAIIIGMRKGLDHFFKDYIFPENKWNKLEESKQVSIFFNHFNDLSNKLKCKITPCEEDYNSLAYFYLQQKNYLKAIEIFRKNIDYHPSSSNGYDSLGEAMEAIGKINDARALYKKAIDVEIKGDNNTSQLSQYKEHLVRVTPK